MKNKMFITICALLTMSASTFAQSILDAKQLAYAKVHLKDAAYSQAFRNLVSLADGDLLLKPPTVMTKEYIPASGSKHDYVSLARYAWPDETQPNGLPYVMRDGVSNPELKKFDRNKLSAMANAVYRLSLAYYFSGEEKYAQKATELIRVWFIDKKTKVNPNLRFAQHIPGKADGRCYGVIDAYSYVKMLDGVQLLEKSKSFTQKDSKLLKAWFSQLLKWLLTHPQAIEESYQKNNHATAYDVQVAAYALYTGNKKVFSDIVDNFSKRRIATQIMPDGKQPYELRRTLAFGYSQYNLTHIIDLMLMIKHQGVDFRQYCVSGEHSFFKAMDFLAPYMGKSVSDWPYQQISGWEDKQQEMAKDFYRTYLLDESRKDYFQIYRNVKMRDWRDLFVLTYEKPTKLDNAMANADEQLHYALKCTSEARKTAKGNKVNPRSIDKDGNLGLVGPKDWCSGFFAGTLWQDRKSVV